MPPCISPCIMTRRPHHAPALPRSWPWCTFFCLFPCQAGCQWLPRLTRTPAGQHICTITRYEHTTLLPCERPCCHPIPAPGQMPQTNALAHVLSTPRANAPGLPCAAGLPHSCVQQPLSCPAPGAVSLQLRLWTSTSGANGVSASTMARTALSQGVTARRAMTAGRL